MCQDLSDSNFMMNLYSKYRYYGFISKQLFYVDHRVYEDIMIEMYFLAEYIIDNNQHSIYPLENHLKSNLSKLKRDLDYFVKYFSSIYPQRNNVMKHAKKKSLKTKRFKHLKKHYIDWTRSEERRVGKECRL